MRGVKSEQERRVKICEESERDIYVNEEEHE